MTNFESIDPYTPSNVQSTVKSNSMNNLMARSDGLKYIYKPVLNINQDLVDVVAES